MMIIMDLVELIEESVRKYGKENHTKEILGTFDNRLDSMNYEHELVKKKRQIEKDPKILNLSNGGGFNLTRQQVSDYGIPGRLKGIEWHKNRSKRIEEEYYKNPKVCKVCGKIIPYEKKHDNECFCSSSCAAKYNNKLYPKRAIWKEYVKFVDFLFLKERVLDVEDFVLMNASKNMKIEWDLYNV